MFLINFCCCFSIPCVLIPLEINVVCPTCNDYACARIRPVYFGKMSAKVVLRYFDCQARGEPLRIMLVDSGIDFVDDRVGGTFEDKKKVLQDPNRGGPFKSLPILHWDSFMTPGCEAIASYLGHKLGYVADGSLESKALSAALCACGLEDIIKPSFEFLCLGGFSTAKTIEEDFAACFSNLRRRIEPLEQFLGKQTFFLGDELCPGDFFVYTACEFARKIFGEKLLEGCDQLKNFLQRMSERPHIQQYLKSGRQSPLLCGSIREDEVVQKTRHLL